MPQPSIGESTSSFSIRDTIRPAGPVFNVFVVASYIAGADVPSDQWPTGIRNTLC